jgi:hypothetical protein
MAKEVQKRTQVYYKTLFTLGFFYLAAVPLSILFSYMSEPYNRQYIFTFTSQMSMFFATLALFYQVTSKKSALGKSKLDAFGILPGSFSHRD